MGFVHDIRSFFGELQHKDDRTKRQWAIGLTSASMLVVTGFWLLTLNSALGSISAPQPSSDNQFFATIARGFAVLEETISASIRSATEKIGNSVGATNSVTIQAPAVTPATVEPLTVQQLP